MAGAQSPPGKFTGFPPEAFDFYRRLEADNSKAFWMANKSVYDSAVRGPLEALTAEVADEFGSFHLFRPHRDVRFSKDKRPYKDHQGAVTEGEGGEAYYLQISSRGLLAGSGYHHMASDQLERYRRAVDAPATGDELAEILVALGRRYDIGGEALKTAPRGYPRDHPRVGLLRHKGVTATRTMGMPKWVSTRTCLTKVVEVWKGAAPLGQWLNTHVGPSTEPPDERR